MIPSFVPMATQPVVEPVAPGGQLVVAALLGIGLIVVLITLAKVHPFLALILGGSRWASSPARTSTTSSRASRLVSVTRPPASAP